ncbi:MAG TPA: DUF116 domain-containing protein, partial [Smithellaceae bacterium]|nr:DUF116 domain-containing protein [Smithellaceae bacterium]
QLTNPLVLRIRNWSFTIKFALLLLLYPLRNIINKMGFPYSIVDIANNYYRDAFNQAPRKDSAVLLPHCLIDKKCPGKFSKENGILCSKCKLCRCAEIYTLCEEKGFQFYIVPSTGFAKRLAERKKLKAAIGVICIFDVEKGLRSHRLTGKGVSVKKEKVIPQVLLTARYDCIENEMDWESLKKTINEGA